MPSENELLRRKKISNSLRGIKRYPFSEEHRKKLSISHKGKTNLSSTKFKKGQIPPNKGKKLSIEIKKKISEAHKKSFLNGRIPWNKGKVGVMVAWNKGMNGYLSGDKHYNWQGGKSFEPYSLDWTETLKRAIRERDNYICQLCSQYGNLVHHIDYNKENCNTNNLITLCRPCHTKTNYKREYWIKLWRG